MIEIIGFLKNTNVIFS